MAKKTQEANLKNKLPFNGLFSRTTWVSWHQKVKPFWILMKARDDGVAVASARPYANHLHLALDRYPCQHIMTRFFTGQMLFLMPNHVKALT